MAKNLSTVSANTPKNEAPYKKLAIIRNALTVLLKVVLFSGYCYYIVNDNIPSTISDLAVWRNSPYDLRGYKKAVVPRFSTYFAKNSIHNRGAVLWNLVSDYFKDSCSFKQFHRKVQSDPKFREFRFTSS